MAPPPCLGPCRSLLRGAQPRAAWVRQSERHQNGWSGSPTYGKDATTHPGNVSDWLSAPGNSLRTRTRRRPRERRTPDRCGTGCVATHLLRKRQCITPLCMYGHDELFCFTHSFSRLSSVLHAASRDRQLQSILFTQPSGPHPPPDHRSSWASPQHHASRRNCGSRDARPGFTCNGLSVLEGRVTVSPRENSWMQRNPLRDCLADLFVQRHRERPRAQFCRCRLHSEGCAGLGR